MLLISCFASRLEAQAQNLEAGKSPSQIFAGTCNACHKSPRGLLKTVPAGSLPGFLRQHYTTSGDMASLLSAFLVSNGAADTRYVGAPPKPGNDAKSEVRPVGPPDQLDRFGRRLRPSAPPQEAARPDAEPPEAARPDAEGVSPRYNRNARRLARPAEAPDATKPGAEGHAALEQGPDGRRSVAKQRLGKRGKPGSEEPPKVDAAKTDGAKEEAPKGEAAADGKPTSETAKDEGNKGEDSMLEGGKPSGETKSESVGIEPANKAGGGSPPVLRADPVPPVTAAPPASPAVSAAAPSETPEPAPAPSAAPAPPSPPAATASVRPAPPSVPAGPPAPPISQ
jgi:hypothetical protein